MTLIAQLLHCYPGVRWKNLSIAQFFGLLHRVPDVLGLSRSEASGGDLLEMEYRRATEGI